MAIIGQSVQRAFVAFADRRSAGRALVEAMGLAPDPDAVVLAVPRGGVPVGEALAEALGAPLDLILVRKLPIPQAPEAGFGAVALDGSVVLNESIVPLLGLTAAQIERIAQDVLGEVRRRATAYRGHDRLPDVAGKRVYMVDDGLASGYTMIAAATMVRGRSPAQMTLCVPVSPADSIRAAEPYFDTAHCLICQAHAPFAVASFYADFRDLTDAEVSEILNRRARALREKRTQGPA